MSAAPGTLRFAHWSMVEARHHVIMLLERQAAGCGTMSVLSFPDINRAQSQVRSQATGQRALIRSPDGTAPSRSGRARMAAAPRSRTHAVGRVRIGCCVSAAARPACAAGAAGRVPVPFRTGSLHALHCCGGMLTSQCIMHWLASSALILGICCILVRAMSVFPRPLVVS